jgi:hypothetical protein
VTGNRALAQDAATRALDGIEQYGDDADFAALLDTMSMWFGLAGYRRMTALVRRAAAATTDVRNPASLNLLGNLAANIVHDDPAEAARVARTAMESARQLGLNDITGLGHTIAADLSVGDFDEAIELLSARSPGELSQLVDWETYVVAGSGLLAWHKNDPSLLRPPITDAQDSEDLVVAAWWLMREAVRVAFEADVASGAAVAAAAVDRMAKLGPAHEDMPYAYALAVDMLVEAGDMVTLERVTAPLETLSPGQRFRLLEGQMLRARAHLSGDALAGLRQAVEVFEAMGAAFWAARTRVELAAALAADGEAAEASAVAAEAEPLLREIGAARAVAQLNRIERSAVPTA